MSNKIYSKGDERHLFGGNKRNFSKYVPVPTADNTFSTTGFTNFENNQSIKEVQNSSYFTTI